MEYVEKNRLSSSGSKLAQEFHSTWLNLKPQVFHSYPHFGYISQTRSGPFCCGSGK